MVVDENPEISVAKSIVSDTNRSSAGRTKPITSIMAPSNDAASSSASTAISAAGATGGNVRRRSKRVRRDLHESSSVGPFDVSGAGLDVDFVHDYTTDTLSLGTEAETSEGWVFETDEPTTENIATTEETLQNDDPLRYDVEPEFDINLIDDGNETTKTSAEESERMVYHEEMDNVVIHTLSTDGKLLHDTTPVYETVDSLTNQTQNSSKMTHGPQRILVNVSIGTDTGSGTQNHAIYMLHVSVPAGTDFTSGDPTSDSNPTSDNVDDDDVCPPKFPPAPPCPCQCSEQQQGSLNESQDILGSAEEEIEDATELEQMTTDRSATEYTENTTENITTVITDRDVLINEVKCPENIPILILEGNRAGQNIITKAAGCLTSEM